jgi:hypothetical protein
MKVDYKKYLYSFLITGAIFATAIFASNYFSNKRVEELRNIQSSIAVDILSSETQFSLLSELSCRDISNTFLSSELGQLGDRLSYAEESLGADDQQVQNLKKYYSLLQIKDFLLSQQIRDKCGRATASPTILYFYSNKGDCGDCQREGYVLTKLRQDYPELRVYSFDYNLDLAAIQTLTKLYNIEAKLPALLVNDKVHYGFKSVDDVKNIVPALKELDKQKAAQELKSQATSSKNQ